jgi:AraC-like DNA-binding protein/mannose-6-phosphate isomerase-like protein (cupin superfamily)
MQQGQDISAEFPGLFLIHQKITAYDVREHRHDSDHELFLPLQGEIQLRFHDQVLKAGPGKMLYMPPGIEHAFSSSKSGEGERLIAVISAKLWKASSGTNHQACILPLSQLSKELLFHLLIHPRTKTAKSLIATFVETLSEMLENPSLGGQKDTAHLRGKISDIRLKKAVELIEDSYREAIPLEKIARSAGLSVRSLNRLAQIELGLTPKQILTLKRVDEAKSLLKQKKAVTDVALSVGYSSVSQFITVFRKATGRLPSGF